MSNIKYSTFEDEQDPSDAYHKTMYEHYQAHAEGTNINPTTLLTSDYLNHFNGFMMLLEMMPSAPEDFADELLSWVPMSYVEHFKSSGFRDKELAVAAYEHVPAEIRGPFEHTIEELNDTTAGLLEEVKDAMMTGQFEEMDRIAQKGVPKLQELIAHAGSIVNGVVVESASVSQSTVDAIFD